MDGKQKGFTLIEILVVVTIIGVLAGLVVVLIPRGQFEAKKAECMNNCKQIVGFFELMENYPKKSGPNMILYLVKRGDLNNEDKDSMDLLFCPGDESEGLEQAGGLAAYKDLDLNKRGEYDHLTSYAGRDQLDGNCAARKGSTKTVVLVCDDSEDHHDDKGFVVGLSAGAVKWRHKVDDYEMDVKSPVAIGEGSPVDELKCLRAD